MTVHSLLEIGKVSRRFLVQMKGRLWGKNANKARHEFYRGLMNNVINKKQM